MNIPNYQSKTIFMELHSNLSYPGSAEPEGARKSEFAWISEKLLSLYYEMLKKGSLINNNMWIHISVNYTKWHSKNPDMGGARNSEIKLENSHSSTNVFLNMHVHHEIIK